MVGSKLYLYVVLSFLIGIFVAVLLVYLYEGYFGLVSHRWQVEKLLRKKVDDVIKNGVVDNRNISYIQALLNKQDVKHIIVIGVGFLPEQLEKNLMEGFFKKHVDSAVFPEDAVMLGDVNKKGIIVAIKPGLSTVDDIKKIRVLLPENYIAVLVE